MFLRNQFNGVGMFKLPLVKKQEISLEDVSLIGYDKVNQSNDYNKIVHFFLDDLGKDNQIQTAKNKAFQRDLTFSLLLCVSIARQKMVLGAETCLF